MNVYLSDENIDYDKATDMFNQAHTWAVENCRSYRGCHIQDVSDVSYLYDQVAEFVFEDERDTVIFTLRWK